MFLHRPLVVVINASGLDTNKLKFCCEQNILLTITSDTIQSSTMDVTATGMIHVNINSDGQTQIELVDLV